MARAIDINDREGLRKVLREINLDDYKTSEGMSSLIEEDRKKGTSYREGMITEDELIEVFRYLRTPSGKGGKTNMEYLSEYKKERTNPFLDDSRWQNYGTSDTIRRALVEEKMRAEKEYANNTMQQSVIRKPSLDEIKARYMREMDALTKKFQDEINNLN